jgi:hypothetical protein
MPKLFVMTARDDIHPCQKIVMPALDEFNMDDKSEIFPGRLHPWGDGVKPGHDEWKAQT